jgi:hypothetical protein
MSAEILRGRGSPEVAAQQSSDPRLPVVVHCLPGMGFSSIRSSADLDRQFLQIAQTFRYLR